MEGVIIKSDYETERNKPIPSVNHGIIQANIIGLFFTAYRQKYRIVSELSTQLDERKRVPDVSIYAKENPVITFNHRKD